MLTFWNVPDALPEPQVEGVVMVTSAAAISGVPSQDLARLTAYCWGLEHSGDAIAAHRAVCAATDCRVPRVHIIRPPSMHPNNSRNRALDTMANSRLVAPPVCRINDVGRKCLIANAPLPIQ